MKIGDMRWQFGGNFQPVRVICTENWKTCLIEIWKYLWSEVVTEVVDYLTDDVFIWKVLMALVVLIILIHTMYYKIRWVDEKSSNKENLNKVGFKVQDLELKVNILTYKMQYGTWPLPNYICKSDKRSELQKIRLTLNPEDRNSWIKHLLLSSRKIKDYNFANRNLVPSVTDLNGLVNLETKYVSSKFHNQIPSIESGDLTDKSSGDNSLREWKRCKRYFSSNKMQITRQENPSHQNLQFSKISKNNSTILNGSSNSSENCSIQVSQINKQRRKRSRNLDNHNQLRELAESLSEFSEKTCSIKRLCKNNQLRRDASEQKVKSDINCKTKRADEGHLEKLEPLKMEKLTKTEDSRESRIEEMSSINEIQSLTDDTLKEYSNLSNSKITFLQKTESRPSSIDKCNLTTQETLDQVKEKLKNLHDILLTYESSDCEQNCSLNKNSSLNNDVISNKSILKIDTIEIPNSIDSEQFESLDQSYSSSSSVINSKLFKTPTKTIINPNRIELTEFEINEKMEKILETECKISSNTFTKIESKSHLSEVKSDLIIESFDINLNNNKKTISRMENNTNCKTDIIPMDTSDDDQFSQSSSQIEFSNDEILDNQLSSLQNKNTFIPELKIQKSLKANNDNKLERNDENIPNLEINNENIPKNPNFERKNTFQSKFLNVLPEEQSVSSLTESTSKKSDEEDQNLGENSKTLLSSASSEYFSFVNLTHKEKNSKSELWDNASQIDDLSAINKTLEDSSRGEKNVNSKQIKFLKKERKPESEYEERKLETEREPKELEKKKSVKSKELKEQVKEKVDQDECQEQIKKIDKNDIESKNYKFDTEIKRINRNFISTTDSSSDESIVKFIKELTSDKVKSTQVFKETKFSKNFTKSNEKLFNIDEVQEQESVLSLQRRPGTFSLTENESKENIFKSLNVNSSSNSENKINEINETRNINNHKNRPTVDSSDSQLIKINKKIVNENLSEEQNLKTHKSIIEILKTKKDSKELKIETSKRKKSEKSFNSDSTKNPENEEKINNIQLYSHNKMSKDNLEAIFENNNKSLDDNKEVMLIDLSDDTPKQKSNLKTVKTLISEKEKYNILDEILKEKNIENKCLVPHKIPSISELTINNNNNQSESESLKENYLNTSGDSIFEKSTTNNSQNSKKKISENTFNTSSSALVDSLPDTKKYSTLDSTEISRKSVKNSTEKDKLNEKSTIPTNSPVKQLRAKSYLNLTLNKEKSENPIQRRSRSFASPRMIQRDFNNDSENSENTIEKQLISKTSLKLSESQKSSKSCIPILKSRLENIRKEPKPRYRSPTRGPLTINPAPDELDYKVTKFLNEGINNSENSNNNNNEKSFGDNTGSDLPKEEAKSDEKTVIYINIMTGQDQSTRKVVNPKKFLELMKDRENNKFPSKEKSQLSNFMNETKRNLPSRFLFQVEQKEREVSVKPSVIDNSTSISDFPQFCNDENRFKIFDVPEELTKEEYIHLLDLLNQDSNLEQLKKMHSLCSKLGLGFQE